MTDTPSTRTGDEFHSCCSACDLEPVETMPLTDLPEALEQLDAMAETVEGTQTMPLAKALGHVLAEDVKSRIPLPVYDNSAVDGYAVRMSAVESAKANGTPYMLPVGGRIAAGDDALKISPDEVCVRILTGATVPDWADGVIMQEDTELSEDGSHATFSVTPKPGANIRRKGEDVAAGSVIVEKGARIDTRHIAIAAAAGLAELVVCRPLRVALLATGSELNQPGAELPPGGIYDSNTPMLTALLSRTNIELTIHRTVQDDFETIRSSIATLAESHDLLMTSGGMSVSDEDHIRRAIAAQGGTFQVRKIRLKPGKPLGFGKIGGCIFIGLPGNPFAALVGFLLFGNAALDALSGVGRKPAPLPGEADFTTAKGGKRLEFIPVRISGYSENGLPKLDKIGRGGSARLRPLIEADGLAALPVSDQGITQGQRLEFYPFHCAFELG